MSNQYPHGVVETAFRDFCTSSFLVATLVPFFAALLVFLLLGITFWGYIVTAAREGFAAGLEHLHGYIGDVATAHTLLSRLISLELVQSASLVVFSTIVLYLIFVLALAVQLITLGFLMPWIARVVHRRHYPHLQRRSFGNSASSLLYIFTVFIIIGGLMIVSLPLLLIPGIGFLLFHALMFMFFKKMLQRDAASQVITRSEYQRIKSVNRGTLLMMAALLYVIALIPIIGLLLQAFYAAAFVHFFLREAEELRTVEAFKTA